MANLTSVGVTSGVPTSGTGTVSTLDNLIGVAGTPVANVQTVQGVTGMTAVKVDGSAVTQPVSGTVTAAQVTAANLNATVAPSSAAAWGINTNGSATSANSSPVVIANDQAAIPVKGNAANGSPVTGFPNLVAGSDGTNVRSVSTDTTGRVNTVANAAVTTASPTYTTGTTNALSLDTSGNLRVNVVAGGGAGGTSSSFAATMPSTGTAIGLYDGTNMVRAKGDETNGLWVNVKSGGGTGGTSSTFGSASPSTGTAVGASDGTNMQPLRIKAASTAPVATDPALVVAISPNSVNANGSATSANSAPVVIASDQAAVATKAASGAFVAGSIADLAHGQATMANSVPVAIASNQSAIPVTLTSTTITGTVATSTAITATANGGTASRVNSAASTNATSLKASAGQLYSLDVFNNAAYNVYMKLYNKASAPTVGTDTPVMTIPVQAGGGFSKVWPMGFPFATGIAYAITKLQADSDTTVVVAGDLTGNTIWI